MVTKINVGVVGLNWGRKIIDDHLISGSASPYFRLAAVCQRDKKKADAVAARYKVKAHYDVASLLADPEIQAVFLMTGPVGRAEIIKQIVDAGKHVLTTKPFEVDAAAAFSVLQHAKQRGVVVHLNSPTPLCSPDLLQIKNWQKELHLGRPIAARADIWSNYRELADGSWYDDGAQCPVSPIFRLGIYLINDLIRLFGQPDSVSVMHSRLFTNRPTPDNAQLSIQFKNGALVNVFSSFCIDDAQWWLSSLTLNFENGTIYRNVRPSVTNAPRTHPELTLVVRGDGKPVSKTVVVEGSTEDYQWEAFYRAINGEKLEDEITTEEIVGGLEVIEAMVRADKSGRVEKVLSGKTGSGC